MQGEFVGVDEQGNRYYRSRRSRLHGRERRWVVYDGPVEAAACAAGMACLAASHGR